LYATYLGGAQSDLAHGVAIDGSGSAFIVGDTNSPDFPIANPLQAKIGDDLNGDAFIARLDASGTALIYSTYLGGNNSDFGSSIAIDGLGNAYVTGSTASTNFPTANALQPALGGATTYDGFVSMISPDGTNLVYSTYLGGSNNEFGYGIAVDGSGNAYVTGTTWSLDFPVVNPIKPRSRGSIDAFVSKIDASGSAISFSTYLGGDDDNVVDGTTIGFGISVDLSRNVYVVGETHSLSFPTVSPLQQQNNGSYDAFVTKIATVAIKKRAGQITSD
jgi:hypothetical protein